MGAGAPATVTASWSLLVVMLRPKRTATALTTAAMMIIPNCHGDDVGASDGCWAWLVDAAGDDYGDDVVEDEGQLVLTMFILMVHDDDDGANLAFGTVRCQL